uniref:Uncharacterized protein n=1 Tax=Crocodylus porosus TaxID=8502 RepID=A0A7M4E3T9_CROPO
MTCHYNRPLAVVSPCLFSSLLRLRCAFQFLQPVCGLGQGTPGLCFPFSFLFALSNLLGASQRGVGWSA